MAQTVEFRGGDIEENGDEKKMPLWYLDAIAVSGV
jgi:hypothetical protein